MSQSNHNQSNNRIVSFLFLLCVIQPLLDVLSFWINQLGYSNTLTLAVRMLVLLVTLFAAYRLAENRRAYYIMIAALGLIAACHVFACIRASGMSGGEYSLAAAVIDLTNYVRIAQLPLFTLCFITLLKRTGDKGLRAVETAMLVNLLIIAAVEGISVITRTNPFTYPNKSIGILGWFYFANSQSAILSMIIPLAICASMKREKRWVFPVITALGFLMLLLFATRLAYLAIFITAIGMILVLAISGNWSRRAAAWLLVLALACAAVYPISPMVRNQKLVAENAVRKQQRIDRLIEKGTKEFGNEDTRRLQYAYEDFLGAMVHKYGLTRVAEAYHESESVKQLSDRRLMLIIYNRLMLQDLPFTSSLFGINYNDLTFEDNIFDVENDFHGIRFLCGICGLVCMLIFFGYLAYRILCALIRDFLGTFTLEAGACGIALCNALLHAYATAGVLRRPNATFYLSLIFAMIWYFSRIRTDEAETE